MPALLLDTGEVITETPLIIQAIAPQVYANTTTDLPNIAKAFGILAQGVRFLPKDLPQKEKSCTPLWHDPPNCYRPLCQTCLPCRLTAPLGETGY
ncbi:hypothetical protein LP122_12210 [Moraxella bovis]|uniref:hypothetical protein n=1 Tax=Moraxella bovis TaxID=476 RepID=UPI0022261A79|nr:hypothetical protein [Moraxella bovis]UYZ68483.1 hypothetical protein LP122_12210 [Moraxella bovis]UZA27485.1 hypothetical protein LP119_00370 [Moraxella bovis]UZA37982.1 hypothetical protein LP101_12715 [Moraxella bovis]